MEIILKGAAPQEGIAQKHTIQKLDERHSKAFKF